MDDTTFNAALKHLGASLAAGVIDRQRYRRDLAELLQQQFGCSRVGLWQIFGERGGRVMRCLARHDEGEGASDGGEEIREDDYRDYFAVLVSQGVYVAPDAWNDPVLAPMRDSYLVPANTRSMMDAAFTLNGRTFGVVCCEQTGRLRDWSTAEVTQLKRAAAMITLHTARHERGESGWWDTGQLDA
ncbi:GAF domain-containing protein [Ideonella sp. BN130291]|uniref:GAF domain-containing protein n=1 Tax=Ideonella sp. BN130291 TaxID=3112940 RepID=UPI002E25B268|nr:GAF domain-containing protein [Ideonella sp. BN130291]